MSRVAVALLISALMIFVGIAPAAADYVGGLDPNGDNFLSLRAGPGTGYSTIERLGPDTTVTVLGRDGRWLRVELESGTKGWVYDAYILPGEAPPPDASYPPKDENAAAGSVDENTAVQPATRSVGKQPPQIVGWTSYTNERFGYSVEYPAGAFQIQPGWDNEDGREFLALDSSAHFFVYAAANAFERTLEEQLAEDRIGVEGDVLTYERKGENWYVLSGIRGEDVFYRKVVLSAGHDVVATLEFDYPRSEKRIFDPVAARIAASLVWGDPGGDEEAGTGAPATNPEEPSDKIAQVAVEPPSTDGQLESLPVEPEASPEVTFDSWRAPLSEVLFNGVPDDRFVPHAAHGGVFSTEASYRDGALVVDVPPNSGWGKVGLLSPNPLVWMDDFRDDAETRVTFAFDPAGTSGFGLALAEPGWGGVAGNDPGYPGARFYWIRQSEGTFSKMELHIDPHGQGEFWSGTGGADAPTEVTFVLRPGEVCIELDGKLIAERDWPALSDGRGYRIYAFSHAADANLPTRMALKRISVTRSYPTLPENTALAPGVKPLPTETVFTGTPTAVFEAASIAGGDFDAFARYAEGALVIDVPEGHSWGKTGLISAEPLVVLDNRIRETPMRLGLRVDPARTDTFVLALAGDKVVEMWPGHVAWFVLSRRPDQGVYLLQVHQGPYNDRVRAIPDAWFNAHWDGHLEYDLGNDFGCIRISAGPALCAQLPLHPDQPLYGTILAHAPVEGKATRLVLEEVTRGLVTPPGLTADRRWHFLDDSAFDPDAYLTDLGGLLQ